MARVPQPPASAGPFIALCWHRLPEVEPKKVWEPSKEIPGVFCKSPKALAAWGGGDRPHEPQDGGVGCGTAGSDGRADGPGQGRGHQG